MQGILGTISSLEHWFLGLSNIGKFFFPVLFLCLIGLFVLFMRALRAMWRLTVRFIRRKMIPKNINLHLDRQSGNQRQNPTLGKPDKEEEYGSSLRDRIEEMHNEAPFKKKD